MIERQLVGQAEALMDISVLREILTLLGPEGPTVLRRIVETYLRETPPLVEDLGEALWHSDYARAEWLAHRLKGSCQSIGASRLALRCDALEEACSARQSPPAAAYAAIVADFTDTRQMLKAFLAELP